VSLLMDALKKAEQAKRGGRLDATPQAEVDPSPIVGNAENHGASTQLPEQSASLPDLPPMPEASTRPAPAMLPELSLKLEQMDQEFVKEASRKPVSVREQPLLDRSIVRPNAAPAPVSPPPFGKRSPSPASDATNRIAAQNAFAAKQPPAAGNGAFGIVVGAITLLAVAAIGVYFWLQLKPSNGLSTPQTVAMPNPGATAPTVGPNPATTRAQPAQEPRLETAARPRSNPAINHPAEPRPTPGAATLATPIHITSSQLKINPALADGFEAFQAGNLSKARADYERVLQSDPRNADALRGAAAIALREGRSADAETYYQRLLEADPQDAIAQAGLVGLGRHNDPVASESRLKTLLATQPDAPVLHFALGNLYAQQSRWNDAQQAYFNAVAGDGDNPDYLFNLAVSLDQMHQSKLAAQYYRQALTAATMRPAGFDQGKVAARLRDLQP
jgi:tetratricopeptide (TPR) repeat protein